MMLTSMLTSSAKLQLNKRGTSLLLNSPSMNFARYFNRAQEQDYKYKTDMTSYQYKPDLIYKIDPAPEYPDGPLPLPANKKLEQDKFRDSLEKFRDNSIAKRRQRDRFMTGRLFAHLRKEELRSAVQEIHDKETSGAAAAQSEDAAFASTDSTVIKEKGVWVDRFEYDDQFKLPYGVGFDNVIKKKADMIDKQKFWNNRVMDELVTKLGYMDYRDALAVNKYILESKRHGDYHQQARSKILTVAMSKYNSQKRVDIEQRSAAQAQGQGIEKDEAKLRLIMNEDTDMSRLYREAYGDIKADKEHDYDESLRIDEKYAYLFDKQTLNTKKPTDKYNLQVEKPTLEEEILTSEMSDEALDLVYKRYKFMQAENTGMMREIDVEAKEFVQNFNAGQAKAVGQSGDMDRSVRGAFDFQNELGLILNKKQQRIKFSGELEQMMGQIRFMHTMNSLKEEDVYNENDPMFPGIFPQRDSKMAEEFKNTLPRELQKLFNPAVFTEGQSALRGIVRDENEARIQDGEDELREKYFRAKWNFYVREKMNQLKVSTKDLEEAAYYHGGPNGIDEQIARRAELMYDYFDYDNDRARVRNRFMQEANKKTSLKEIGEMLDQFILDERSDSLRYTDITKPLDKIKSASKDTSSFEMSWTGRIFKNADPLKPLLLDEDSELDQMPEGQDTPYRDILDRIKYEDSRTDYSFKSLTPEQRTEMALFHSFKQDPYYKHFLHNHLRQFAEDIDEGVLNFPEGPYTKDVTDVPKFDRINLYDFRRALPQKDREAKLDASGASWGFGKRKTSHSVVRVKPGKGVININGQNMLDYFTLASQRYRILLPLMITQYTCLLDVDIWVHGGGFTGQAESIVPGLAKAIQNYDVKTRPVLKYFRLMRHDPRNVERKKYGRIKARKGQVYRRR